MLARFRIPAASVVALCVTLAACSDTSGGRGAGESREGPGASASGTSAPDAAPIQTELKRRIRTDQVAATRALFGLVDPADSTLEVTFYDTPSLDLLEAGLILRTRKVKGGEDDVTVKLRPLARSAVAAEWFKKDGFKCEADESGPTAVEACSLTVERKAGDIDKAAAGTKSIESILSDPQRDFIRTYSRVMPEWNELKPCGPIAAREWEVSVQHLKDKLAAELWTLPDGTQMLEFSVKAEATDAEATAAALDDVFRTRGVELMTDGRTKTRDALEALRAN